MLFPLLIRLMRRRICGSCAINPLLAAVLSANCWRRGKKWSVGSVNIEKSIFFRPLLVACRLHLVIVEQYPNYKVFWALLKDDFNWKR